MEFIILLFVLCIGIMIFRERNRKKESNFEIVPTKKEEAVDLLLPVQIDDDLFLTISELNIVENNQTHDLVEITDKKLLTKINDAFPHIGQLILNSQSQNTTNQLVNQINDFNTKYSGKIYEAIIPPNTKLFDSKALQGAVRGGYLDIDKHTKQANFMPVDTLNPSSVNSVANIASNAMNIASLVVGQYYMVQIDDTLENIHNDICDIKDYLSNNRLSEIEQLVINVSVIIKHQNEISSNEFITEQELQKLYDYEETAGKVLSHVNKDIAHTIKKTTSEFEDYRINTLKLDKLLKEQEILIKVMNQISSLKYILYHGTASTEYCYERFNIALTQSLAINKEIELFHRNEINTISIDLQKGRYKKSYFLDNVVQPVISLIDEDINYVNIDQILMKKINNQLSNMEISPIELNTYEKETKLLIKDGKIYYEN